MSRLQAFTAIDALSGQMLLSGIACFAVQTRAALSCCVFDVLDRDLNMQKEKITPKISRV
jgi:hypothetical protein